MRNKFRMGVIGCGDIARYVILAGKANKNIQIVGCADLDEKRAQKYARWFRIPAAYSDYTDMLKEVKMDAVYLAVPHYLHYPIIKEIMDYDLHIFSEKPLVTSLDDAVELSGLAANRGIKLGTNCQYRYDNNCYALVQACRRGDLGEIYYGRSNVPWHRSGRYFELGPWRANKSEAGGGTLMTQAIHSIDFLLWALGGKPLSVYGIIANAKFKDIEVEDLGMGVIEMDNGRYAEICSSMVVTPEQKVTVEVYGEKCMSVYTTNCYYSSLRFKGAKVKKDKFPVKGIHAISRCLEYYRRWVLYDEEFLNKAENSYNALAAILAVYKSARSGKKEPVAAISDAYIIE